MSKNRERNNVLPVQRGVAPVVPSLSPCNTCRWRVRYGNGLSRCHAEPPQVRFPYDNMACWPVVPDTGGGCRLHEGVAT